MNSHVAVTRKTSKPKQSGAATIMVILMIGVGLVAVSVGTMHTMRSTQERQQVAHAQVNAQSGAWAAVEVARQYLGTLKADQLKVLGTNPWSIIGPAGLTQSVKIASVSQPDLSKPTYRVNAQVSAVATAGGSTSTIEVVYEVTPGAAPANYTLNAVLDFYNDLDINGGMTFNVPNNPLDPTKRGLNFNVDGNMTLKSVGITGNGIGVLKVTGNLEAGSAVNAQEVYARNITVTQGAAITEAYAFGDPDTDGGVVSNAKTGRCCGNITLTENGALTHANANGSVVSDGAGISGVTNARRDVTITRWGTYGTVISGTNINANSGGTLVHAKAIGDLTLGQYNTTSALAMGSIVACNPDATHTSLRAGGTISAICKSSSKSEKSAVSNADIGVIDPIDPIAMTRPTVDAWALETAANYAIKYHVASGGFTVEVKNVNGVPNGSYYLKATNAWQKDPATGIEGAAVATGEREFLCPVAEGSKLEKALCEKPAAPFCWGFSSNKSCFGWSTSTLFNIDGKSLPPGVIWIQGDLNLGTGTYYNTFISTGNITTSGAFKSYSVNYASGYKATPSSTTETPKNATCKNEYAEIVKDFAGMYPTNFCDSSGSLIANALGNIGVLAGGTNPVTKTYTGGNISLNNSNTVYGTVVAGNLLTTSGETKIYGFVSAAGSQLSNGKNVAGNSTTIDLNNLPKGYNPGEIPDMSGGGAGVTAESKVLWTRYL